VFKTPAFPKSEQRVGPLGGAFGGSLPILTALLDIFRSQFVVVKESPAVARRWMRTELTNISTHGSKFNEQRL
jgi:hypothetical protein